MAVDGLARGQVTMSTGSRVIDCSDEAVSSDTPVFISMYNAKGNMIAIYQVPENLLPSGISDDILERKLAMCAPVCNNLQTALEDNES